MSKFNDDLGNRDALAGLLDSINRCIQDLKLSNEAVHWDCLTKTVIYENASPIHNQDILNKSTADNLSMLVQLLENIHEALAQEFFTLDKEFIKTYEIQ